MRTGILAAWALLWSWSAFALTSLPALTGPVVDQAGILDGTTAQVLSQRLQGLKSSGGPQIQVLIMETLGGENIEEFSIRAVEEWKLGDGAKDDGALFVVAMQERKMRIEVGQGLEGQLTDVKSARIIREVKEYFRQSHFSAGVVHAVAGMAQATGHGELFSDEQVTAPTRRARRGQGVGSTAVMIIFVLIILFFRVFAFFERPLGVSRYGRRGVFWGGGGGGFGGGRSSGGGFGGWSGGGGGFSGGGSSGSW